jgi:hypothetical protein
MGEEEILFLSNEPLPPTATSIKLDLRSGNESRGNESWDEEDAYDEEGLLEGYVFF